MDAWLDVTLQVYREHEGLGALGGGKGPTLIQMKSGRDFRGARAREALVQQVSAGAVEDCLE